VFDEVSKFVDCSIRLESVSESPIDLSRMQAGRNRQLVSGRLPQRMVRISHRMDLLEPVTDAIDSSLYGGRGHERSERELCARH